MKRSRLTFAVWVLGALLCPLSALAQKESKLIDFTYIARDPTTGGDSRERAFEYSFGDWGGGKAQQIRDKGLLVNNHGSKGGVGGNRRLNLRDSTTIRVHLIIGNRNRAGAINFVLVDNDGTDHAFAISLSGQPRGQLLKFDLNLAQPTREQKPGTTPGLDFKKLKTWQLTGDFGDLPVEVMVERINLVR